MEKKKIFLASSSELVEDRKEFEVFINRKNKEWVDRGVFLELVIWEDFLDALSQTRLQDEYNKAVKQSDIFVMLFHTKVGKYTLEEFKTAFGQFKEISKPLIYTYFKDSDIRIGSIDKNDMMGLWVFQEKLTELGHFQTVYKNIDELKYKFNQQLEKLVAIGFIQFEKEDRSNIIPDTQKPSQDPVKMYLKAIAEKYATLTMIGFKRSFAMDSIYIPLTVHIDPEARYACSQDKEDEKLFNRSLKAEDLLDLPDKVAVVLGEPGMGKTTMLHYLAHRESIKSNYLFPIFIKLADFSKTQKPLESFLLAAIENYIPGPAMQEAALNAIKAQQTLILLDGLDEVNREEYHAVTEKIQAFIASHRNCRVIITSRKAGFQSHEAPYRLFEIDKLPFTEIETFVQKWFADKTDLAERIANNNRLYELARNPFLLSIICLIFEKDQDLPQRRLKLYEKCTVTLLTLYDDRLPKRNRFNRLLKERVLEDLAKHFFDKQEDEFPYGLIIKQIEKTLADMKKNEDAEEVLREICENSGLLQKSDDNHLFVHRTFYEYYVSRKMREDTPDTVLSRTLESRWEEPLRLYAAQIESITEGTQFLKKLWEKDQALALRCYPDMDRVVEPECIKNLLEQANVSGRVELVKGLPDKIVEPEKIVETLRELFRWETNGEVLYWGVQILEEREEIKKIAGAADIVRKKLDDGAKERYQRYVANDMIRIPAGMFLMGSPDNEAGRIDDETQHKVKVSEFLISRYQVTNRLYEEFDSNHRKQRNEYSDKDKQPVIYVNWYEAVIFSRWLGCRLFTEAEWEYACRAGTTTPFNTGDNLTTDQANYGGDYPYRNYPKGAYIGKTTPVGSYKPNDWGLYDMHGNVYEWCQDWYEKEYYNDCKRQGTVEHPIGPAIGSNRVLRGGGWYDFARYCRSAFRYNVIPDNRDDYIGFRLVFVP